MRRTSLMLSVTLIACADTNSVVGGACAQGYVVQDGTCVRATSAINDGGLAQEDGQVIDGSSNPDGATDGAATNDDGSTNTQVINQNGPPFLCFPPDIACGGVCVDPTSDPDNCGSCGHVCPSNSCMNSKCVGSAPGHVVVIGHDYGKSPTITSAQSRVLSNATLLPLSNPLRVMSYEEYADGTAVTNAESLVAAEAKLLGRTVTFIATTSSTTVSTTINVTTYDVLLVHDQKNAPTGTLATIGTTWTSDGNVATFLHAGGVVVVLTGGTGTAEMPSLATNATLLSIDSQSIITGSLSVLAPADAVGSGVVSPYIPKPSTVSLSTEANGGSVIWVVAQSGSPVVVHKVMP